MSEIVRHPIPRNEFDREYSTQWGREVKLLKAAPGSGHLDLPMNNLSEFSMLQGGESTAISKK